MSSLAIACMMFGCVLASTLLAMLIAQRLPEHHLSAESKDVVKLGLGVVGTLTALVLGLLVSATKGTFDAQSGTIKEVAAQMAMADRVLAKYGTETQDARSKLRTLAESVLHQMWPDNNAAHIDLTGGQSREIGESFFQSVAMLEPTNDIQRLLKSRVLDITVGMGQLRQRLVVNDERSIPSPLLVMLGVWQAILFAGFGLLAPRNATTIAVLVICMVSVSGAIFLIMELDRPFAGIVRVSNAPLRSIISHLGE